MLDRDGKLGEIHAAEKHPDRGHDNIVDQRVDDRTERAAKDDAHGHVHYIAAHRKFLEFRKKAHNYTVWLVCVCVPSPIACVWKIKCKYGALSQKYNTSAFLFHSPDFGETVFIFYFVFRLYIVKLLTKH